MPELIEEQRVGAFLQEKLGNFVTWVVKEVPCEELPPNYGTLSMLFAPQAQCLEFAMRVATMSAPVTARDFDALAQHKEATAAMVVLLHAVEARPHMHERFWRYMDMCVSLVDSLDA
jgi:hypothetical protein